MGTGKKGIWRAEGAVAGYANVIEVLREIIIYPIIYSEESQKLGLKCPRGLLLYGPPGTGKPSLVHAVVRECNAHLTTISPHSIFSPYPGESERLLREAFSEASSHASMGKPSVIFIDEIDALCSHRDSRREEESRIVAQLLSLMSGSKASSKHQPRVTVVASTNRVNAIDPALRRSGRFDVEIEVTAPIEEEHFQILLLYSKEFLLDENVDLKAVAASCNGYVGADLEALCREASMSALHKMSFASRNDSVVTMDDWKHARSKVHPSITRGITVDVPKVSCEDIGGLQDLKWRGSSRGSSIVGERLLLTLLTEMDGLEQTKVLYVPSPDLDGREEILCVHAHQMKLGEDVNLRCLAEDTDLFTGAELAGL